MYTEDTIAAIATPPGIGGGLALFASVALVALK